MAAKTADKFKHLQIMEEKQYKIWRGLMGFFVSFEEINAWKKAREVTKEVYKVSKNRSFNSDFNLKSQMRSAAVSVMSNIAEGNERDGSKEFIHFLAISKGSAAEVKSLLYVAMDQEYITSEIMKGIAVKIDEIIKMLDSLTRYLKKSKRKGSKFEF